MSTYVCHDNQFVLLAVAYLIKDRMRYEVDNSSLQPRYVMNSEAILSLYIKDIAKLADSFKRANIKSVNERYFQTKDCQTKFKPVYMHTLKIIQEWFEEENIFFTILKSIDNYQYQCDEVETWGNSRAKRLTDELYRKYSSFIIQPMQEWQDAGWGFDDR